jgi:hypothetical protein
MKESIYSILSLIVALFIAWVFVIFTMDLAFPEQPQTTEHSYEFQVIWQQGDTTAIIHNDMTMELTEEGCMYSRGLNVACGVRTFKLIQKLK